MFRNLLLLVVAVAVQGNEEPYEIHNNCFRMNATSVCWEVDDYPAEEIEMRLGLSGEHSIFGQTTTDIRYQDADQSCSLCETRHSFKIRAQAVSNQRKLCYVVNTKNYHQVIVYNVCKSDQSKSKCRILDVPQDYEPTCEQKESVIRLLCYNPETSDFEAWAVRYPSACICTVKRIPAA